MTAELWQSLPPSSRKTLHWLAEQWAEGFTGDINLRCLNGSVEEIRPTSVIRPKALDDQA